MENSPEKTPEDRLISVDIARGLAALSIVAFHLNAISWHHNRTSFVNIGDIGVDFFFVLSGFCIATATSRGVLPFLMARAKRIFPALWITVLTFAAVHFALNGTAPTNLIGSLIPYPSVESTEPIIVWTLRHVILFYIFWALWINGFKWITALWALGCVMATVSKFDTGVMSMIFSTYHLQFFLGAAVAIYRPNVNPWIAIVIAVAFLLIDTPNRWATLDYTSTAATWVVLWNGICFAILMMGLARLKLTAPKPILILCAASYEIYILHAPAMGFMARFIDNPFLLLIGGIGAGFGLYLLLQKFPRRWVPQMA